jgi:hypothetical protein
MLVHNVRLSYFTIICNTHEYKMDPGFSRGQLYDVQNEIKISENAGWAYSFNVTILTSLVFRQLSKGP